MKLLRTFALAAAVSLVVTTSALAQGASSLSGVWQGAFWGGEQQPTRFDLTLRDDPGPSFSGSMVEPNVFGEPGFPFLLSTVTGQARGAEFTFVKTYDGTAGQSHSVTYTGRIVSDRRITGTWATGEGTTGNFELAR